MYILVDAIGAPIADTLSALLIREERVGVARLLISRKSPLQSGGADILSSSGKE